MIARVTAGEDLRALMRSYAHGVAVLTVDFEGDRIGVTVSSLVSLSLEPPLAGVSIGKQASCYELLRRAGEFAVSLLSSQQEHLAQHFSRGVPPIAHWDGVATREGDVVGAPLIEGALGWLECRTVAEHDVGDHTFFVAEPLLVRAGDAGGRPLIYHHSHFHSL
jgi:flavin reductase (DIM6/NTAB) family NADH-FMN oxidoreductase RutF